MRRPASKLARVREERGLTQQALGDFLGVAASSISVIENLHTRPWPRFRRKAAKFFALPEDELFPEWDERRA